MSSFTCICDSNIWINVSLGDIHHDYVTKYKVIGVADKVHNELNKFESASGRAQKVYLSYTKSLGNGLQIINISDFPAPVQKLIYSELSRQGFDELDNTSKVIKNLGEFASLVYAYYLEIPFIHTHDIKFCDEILFDELYEQYKGIEIYTWNQLSDELVSDFDGKMKLNKKIEQEQVHMKKEHQNKKEEEKLEVKIFELMNRFNNRS